MRRALLATACLTATIAHAAPAKKVVRKSPSVAAAPKLVPSVLYDFKGIPLEMSIDEFRQRPHPDGAIDAKVVCTGEKTKSIVGERELFEVAVYNDVEIALGVKKCVWVTTMEDKKILKYAGQVVSLDLAGSGYGAINYGFSFVPDPKDGVLKLFEIEVISNRNAFSDVVAGLSGKWGRPKLENDTVQNGMGATFPQVTAIWANPAASITTTDRWSKIDQMAILVLDNRLNGILAQAKAAKKASIPNAI